MPPLLKKWGGGRPPCPPFSYPSDLYVQTASHHPQYHL